MPTKRPRHVVTETETVAAALDAAALRWPEEHGNRSRLLLRLVEAGNQVVAASGERMKEAQRAAITRTSGTLTGAFSQDYLKRLREDWPE